MAAPVLQFKRGNAGVAGTVPALRPGEPAISLNNFDFFIGSDTSVANNKFFGSHRYWTRENGTNSLKLNLVDKGGSNSISIKSPDTLVGSGTYTLPDTNTIVDGYFLKVATDGTLSWDTSSGHGGTFTDTTFAGVTTITGSVNATGADINAGIVTVTDLYIDTTRVLYDDGDGIVLAGISTIDATTKATFEEILKLDPNDFDTLNVVGIATIGGLLDANGGAAIDNIQIGVTGDNEIDTATGSLTLDSASGQTIIDDNLSVTGIATVTGAFVANGDVTLGDTSGDTITINGTTTFNQTITGTATTANTVTITDTDAQSGGIVFGSAGTGSTLYNDTDLTYNSNTNILSAPVVSATTEVRTGAVKAADGTSAITITDTTGAVATGSDLTVGGNLYVNGSTTQVNTASLTVEDRTIELGIVDGAAPTSTTTWDLGVLFNYHDGSAKKSALVWEQGDARFKLGSVVSDGGGTGSASPQLTLTTYAALEIADLWINNTCTGGSQQVIGCIGSELNLQNIVVDAGTF